MKKHVFISYARSDGTEIAEELQSILERHAYTSFYDKRDIEAGDWLEQLIKGISDCKVFVPVLTQGYLKRISEGDGTVIMKEIKTAESEKNVTIISFVRNLDDIGYIPELFTNPQVANNTDQLLGYIFNVIPDALLEQAQNLSENYVNAFRSSREEEKSGILGDSNNIDRTIIIATDENKSDEKNCGRKELPETAETLLENNKAVCFTGDGGCGKTYLLQELFLNICKRVDYYAIYIKLADVFSANVKEEASEYKSNAILEYIETTFKLQNRIETEISKVERIPKVVFFLDGLNEVAAGRFKDAVNAITGLFQINEKIRIILSTRYMPSYLENDFKKITIKDLSEDEIRNYLGRPDIAINKKVLGVLCLPLYLRLYKLILKPGETIGDEAASKVGILRKIFIQQQIDSSGKIISDELRFAYSVILPHICFRMANSNSLNISDHDLFKYIRDAKKAISNQECDDDLETFEYCFEVQNDIDIGDFKSTKARTLKKAITDQLMPLVSGHGTYAEYQICHQDIRDFFAAHYIRSAFAVINTGSSVSGMKKLFEKTLLCFDPDRFDNETIPMITDMLPKQKNKFRLDIPYNKISEITGLDLSVLRLIYYIGNETIEGLHNATEEKYNACKELQDELDLCCRYVMSQKDGTLWKNNTDLVGDIMYLDAQLHRRTNDFDESIQISNALVKFAEDQNNDNLKYRAKNNIAKCELYQSTEYAKKEKDHTPCSEEVINRFLSAVEKLYENSHYWSSGNLYAMLLAYPDLISGRYLKEVFAEKDMKSRRLEAFQIEFNIWETNKEIYALQTCLSYVMHDFISPKELNKRNIIPEATETEKDKIAGKWIETLLEKRKKKQPMVHYFRALLLLKKETLNEEELDKAIKDLEVSYVISNQVNEKKETVKRVSPVIGCFVYTVLSDESKEKKKDALSIIADTMKDKVSQHNTDSFDYWYVLEDLQNTWKFLKCKREKEIRNIDCAVVENMLTELNDIYNKEAEVWRFAI